jgi:hypothetical protein
MLFSAIFLILFIPVCLGTVTCPQGDQADVIFDFEFLLDGYDRGYFEGIAVGPVSGDVYVAADVFSGE